MCAHRERLCKCQFRSRECFTVRASYIHLQKVFLLLLLLLASWPTALRPFSFFRSPTSRLQTGHLHDKTCVLATAVYDSPKCCLYIRIEGKKEKKSFFFSFFFWSSSKGAKRKAGRKVYLSTLLHLLLYNFIFIYSVHNLLFSIFIWYYYKDYSFLSRVRKLPETSQVVSFIFFFPNRKRLGRFEFTN